MTAPAIIILSLIIFVFAFILGIVIGCLFMINALKSVVAKEEQTAVATIKFDTPGVILLENTQATEVVPEEVYTMLKSYDTLHNLIASHLKESLPTHTVYSAVNKSFVLVLALYIRFLHKFCLASMEDANLNKFNHVWRKLLP